MRALLPTIAWALIVIAGLAALIDAVGLSLQSDAVRLTATLAAGVLTSLADPKRFYGLDRQPRWVRWQPRRERAADYHAL